MDCHFLLQGIFPTQGLNLGLPHCRQMLYHLSHQGSPVYQLCKNVFQSRMAIAFYGVLLLAFRWDLLTSLTHVGFLISLQPTDHFLTSPHLLPLLHHCFCPGLLPQPLALHSFNLSFVLSTNISSEMLKIYFATITVSLY